MKLEAFSEVSNLVRHLEGLEARKAQINEARAKGVNGFVIELRKQEQDQIVGGYISCYMYMQAHDGDALCTVDDILDILDSMALNKIDKVKEKLRELGVNLDEGKQHGNSMDGSPVDAKIVMWKNERLPWDKPTPGDIARAVPENATVTARDNSGNAEAWKFS
jgi:hypothetical protein